MPFVCQAHWARPYHICTGTGQPNLDWDWAHPCHICTGIGLARQICTGTGLAPSRLHRDWAHPATSAPGLWSLQPSGKRFTMHVRLFKANDDLCCLDFKQVDECAQTVPPGADVAG